MKKSDAGEGKEEGSFWGANELEWFVQDYLPWEGPHAGAGSECKEWTKERPRQCVVNWSQLAFPIPVKKFSFERTHRSQEALFCKPLPQHNAFDTQISLLLAVWQLVWASHHWDFYHGTGKSIRNLWKTSQALPTHRTETQDRFM